VKPGGGRILQCLESEARSSVSSAQNKTNGLSTPCAERVFEQMKEELSDATLRYVRTLHMECVCSLGNPPPLPLAQSLIINLLSHRGLSTPCAERVFKQMKRKSCLTQHLGTYRFVALYIPYAYLSVCVGYIYVCMYVYTHNIYVYIYTYVYMYIYIYI